MNKTVRANIRGLVQGVGYRDWAQRQAIALGLKGFVRNRRDGSVELLVSGSGEMVDRMIDLCRQGPRLAMVSDIDLADDGWRGEDFQVLPTL